jgi:hypothetical protein
MTFFAPDSFPFSHLQSATLNRTSILWKHPAIRFPQAFVPIWESAVPSDSSAMQTQYSKLGHGESARW